MATNFETLFPTIISRGSLSGGAKLNRSLLSEIDMLHRQDKMGREWSKTNYVGGYTSYGSLSDLHHRSPAFMDFRDALQPHADAFAKSQGWSLRGLEVEMTACWMNIMPRHTYHTSHLHPHSVISGAYYVSVPTGSVSMKIEDPRMGLYMNAPVRSNADKRSGLYYEVIPKTASFILFESWLRHEVPPNQSREPRISISFNYSIVDSEEL